MIKNKKIDMMVRTALIMALTFVVTFFVNVPVAIGNVNLGDSIILVGALFLPGLPLGLAGGVGAAIADVVAGYGVYAPFTLVIKFLEGFVIATLYKYLKVVIKNQYGRYFVATLISVLIIPVGYFFTNWILYDLGGALGTMPNDFIQALGSLVVSNIIFFPLTKAFKNIKTY